MTWKEAENGNGTILRLAEIEGKPADMALHFDHFSIGSAHLDTGVEDDKRDLPVENNSVRLSFKPFEVVTVRIVRK